MLLSTGGLSSVWFNLEAASLSRIKVTFLCFWRMEAGISSFGFFSRASLTAWALFFPEANRIIFFALSIVLKPTVIAALGTSFSELKKRELAAMVESDNLAT